MLVPIPPKMDARGASSGIPCIDRDLLMANVNVVEMNRAGGSVKKDPRFLVWRVLHKWLSVVLRIGVPCVARFIHLNAGLGGF